MLSQLHSVFNTHTLIERDLSALIFNGIIRKIILRGSVESGKGGDVTGLGGDVGLILSSTFQDLLSSHGAVFQTFAKWVEGLGRGTVAISHKTLVEQGVEDEEIKKLIEMGFLVIDYSIGEEGYTICVPGAGGFVRNLRGGRKELLRALKRQKYKEMLEKVQMPSSPTFRLCSCVR
jgi:Serine-threonine protein kinase 19